MSETTGEVSGLQNIFPEGRKNLVERILAICPVPEKYKDSRPATLRRSSSMDVEDHDDTAVSKIAAAIGEPARARMLYCLLDGHARTSTELSVVAEVSPSTASVHLNRLKTAHLVKVLVRGKHRFYNLEGSKVASALEALSIIAGGSPEEFVANTPSRLVLARTCYDHMAGKLGVLLHSRFKAMGWLSISSRKGNSCDLSIDGAKGFGSLGIDVQEARAARRRLACECLDWSERQPHLAGALGAALLGIARKRKWVVEDLDSRALSITSHGQREILKRFDIQYEGLGPDRAGGEPT
jgi:DNA-binding transcriptional ArsR family regulator